MNESDDKPKRSLDEVFAELEKLGISREDAIALADDSASKREHVIEVSQDDALTVISAKLDKLQESVDGLAAKIDSKESA